MRKRIILIVLALMVIFGVVAVKMKETPKYEIVSTIVNSFGDGYKDVTINVVVNVRKYDKEQMLDEVREDYIELNREPDRLLIRLYNKRNDLKKGEEAIQKIYLRK